MSDGANVAGTLIRKKKTFQYIRSRQLHCKNGRVTLAHRGVKIGCALAARTCCGNTPVYTQHTVVLSQHLRQDVTEMHGLNIWDKIIVII